jgi:hypothetical protein
MLSNQGKKAVPVFSLFSKIQDDYFNTENLLSLFDTYVKCIVNSYNQLVEINKIAGYGHHTYT